MTLYRGTAPIIAVYRGATPITAIYRGTVPLWSPDTAGDDFNGAAGPLALPTWADINASVYKLGIEDGRARVLIPDGLLGGFWDFNTSTFRYALSVNPGNNGYVEARLATQGDSSSITSLSGYVTDVWNRGNNLGSTHTHGVGFRAIGGQVQLCSVIGSVVAARDDPVPFQSGAICRVSSVGNIHTQLLNGKAVGEWNDSGGLAQQGTNYRSLIITGQGAKDFLGPRRFSPALDYVKMGPL